MSHYRGLCPQLLCRKKACLGGNRGNKGFNRRALGCGWRFQCGEVHLREKLFEKNKRRENFQIS